MATRKSKTKIRRERQFFPQSSANPILVRLLGAAGAAALGAGAWEQFGTSAEPLPWAAYLLAGGAATFGAAIWFGTSGDPVLRVGQGGVGIDRGGVTRRIPWHAVEKISWFETERAVVVKGQDETGMALTITARLKSQPHGAAWIVEEAEKRAPSVIDLPESAIEALPKTSPDDGPELTLEPVQVVGKRCAKSDKIIAYEPDACVCPNCERIYHKKHVPRKCECGESLENLRATANESGDAADEISEGEATEDEVAAALEEAAAEVRGKPTLDEQK